MPPRRSGRGSSDRSSDRERAKNRKQSPLQAPRRVFFFFLRRETPRWLVLVVVCGARNPLVDEGTGSETGGWVGKRPMGGLSAGTGLNYRALLSSLRSARISSSSSRALCTPWSAQTTCESPESKRKASCGSPCAPNFPSLRLARDAGWSAGARASTCLFSTTSKVALTNTYVTREPGSESLVLESGAMVKRKLYAVKKGRQPGLYTSWKEAEEQVKGYRNAVHRAFSSKKEAETYLQGDEEPAPEAEGAAGCSGSADGDPAPVAPDADPGQGKRKKPSPARAAKRRAVPAKGPRDLKTVRQSDERGGSYHVLQFDGGARGNPGIAGAGVVLFSPEGEVVGKKSLYLGDSVTNNQAEYQALIMGLRLGLELGYTKLEVEGDSELVINQVMGHYEVNNKQLKRLMGEVVKALEQMEDIVIRHIPREQNKIADELANLAMDTMASE